MKPFLVLFLTVTGFCCIPHPRAADAQPLPTTMSADPVDVWKNVPHSTPSDYWHLLAHPANWSDYRSTTDKKGNITASGRAESGEVPAAAFDGTEIPFSIHAQRLWLEYQYGGKDNQQTIIAYVVTPALTGPGCDPMNWRLLGTNDGKKWVPLDQQANQNFTKRLQGQLYRVAKPGAYNAYRFEVTANHGDEFTRVAEFSLLAEKPVEQANKPKAAPKKKPGKKGKGKRK